MTPCAVARPARAQIDIADQPLGAALVEFAIQANVSIATPLGGFGAQRAPSVHGLLLPGAALGHLLSQSSYSYEQIDTVTFRVVPAARPAPMSLPENVLPPPDEIVVTALRRPLIADRIAASVSVVDGDDLDQMGARQSTDLASAIAGLTFTNLGPGRNKIVVRGLSDGAFSGRTESIIGIYLDDARITYGAPDPDLKLVDIERAEILRGPQGALYGGGSIGGVYRITPRAPVLTKFGGSIDASVESSRDGGIGNGLDGVLNLPIVPGRLGFRVVGYRDEVAGWLDNAALGRENTNRTIREGFRATTLMTLGGSWTASARISSQTIDTLDSQYTDNLAGERRRTARVLEPHDNDFRLLSATLRGATPFGELRSTTSMLHHAYTSRFDATGAFEDAGAAPNTPAALDDGSDLEFFVEETRISGVASPVPWSIGAFVSVGQLNSNVRLTQRVTSPTPAILFTNSRDDLIQEYALYSEVTLPVVSRFNLSLGLRGFRTELSTHATATSIDPSRVDTFSGTLSHTGVAPQIQLSFEPVRGAFYYLQASNGYRSGGFNTGAAVQSAVANTAGSQPFRQYQADELWNYEAGVKHQFLNDRLKVRATAFWQNWENIQTDQLIAANLPYTGNIGNGRILGGEVETSLRWSAHIHAAAHLTFADSEIVAINGNFPVSADAGLPGAPQFTGGASIDYERIADPIGILRLHVDSLYVGSSSVTFSDQKRIVIGGYLEANVRLSLERESWSTTLYVTNLTDSDVATFSYGNPFRFGNPELETPIRPRTIGVELGRRF